MSVARLSPTANLLRNSKLFALPPALCLPPAKPTAEPTATSDTATTLYPIKAALETPTSSLYVGDWGLKRALPLKSTLNTGTPTIRLRKDIDTEAHIADFESAADHVITLRKWQDVNPQINNTSRVNTSGKSSDRRTFSVFHPALDNTTNLGSSSTLINSQIPRRPDHLQQALDQMQADARAEREAQGLKVHDSRSELLPRPLNKKRWRYDGPWLAGMSNLEFDTFVQDVTSSRGLKNFDDFLVMREYLTHLDQEIERLATEVQHARTEMGTVRDKNAGAETHLEGAKTVLSSAIEQLELAKNLKKQMEHTKYGELLRTARKHLHSMQRVPAGESGKQEEDDPPYQQYVAGLKKKLRADRKAFAVVIAEFLDLPDGPIRPAAMVVTTKAGDWEYVRDTAATRHYRETGPPRTHPSAGFSYTRSTQYARNDPKLGPARPADILPARLLREASSPDGIGDRKPQQYIGVGGLVARPDTLGTRTNLSSDQWRPMSGGPKMVVKLLDTTVRQNGAIEIGVIRERDFALDEDNMPYNKQDWERELRAQREMPEVPARLEQLDQRRLNRGYYRKAEPLGAGGQAQDQDLSQVLDAMSKTYSGGEKVR